MLVALVWALVATAALVPTARIARSAVLQPTHEGQEYWAAVINADSKTLCSLEDLTQTGETMDQCVSGWDSALAQLKAVPKAQRPHIVHTGTIRLGPNYFLDGYASYKPDGTPIVSMALLIADGKIEDVL